MRFLTLYIKNYGKFLNKKIEFKEGVNIIYGRNEAGKSTIHSFIKGMLFGLERQRGRVSKEDHYIKYQPWEQRGLYGGSLDVKHHDRNYRIYRDFAKETRTYQVIDIDTGREQPVEDKKGISFIENLTEDNYFNTISIEQLKSRTNQSLVEEVKNHLANVSTSKSNQIDVGEALARLKAKRKQLENSDTDRKLTEIERKIEEKEKEEKRKETLSMQMNRLKESLRKEEMLLVNHDITKLEEYIEEFPRILEKYNQYTRLIYEKKELEEIVRTVSVDKGPIMNRRKIFYVPLILSLILLLFGLAIKQCLIVIIGIGIIGTVGVYYVINWFRSIRMKSLHDMSPIQNENKEHKRQSLERLSHFIQEEERLMIQYASRLMSFQQLDSLSMNRLETEIFSLKENLNIKRKEAREKIEQLRIDIEKIRWELDQLEEIENQEIELRELLKDLTILKTREEKEKQAIYLAIETIQSLSITIHDSLGQSINERISNIVRKITKGQYSFILMDENLNIKVVFKEQFIPLESLSIGTIEQIYLALRLAVSDILSPKEKLPVLLDDTFAYYDYERLSSTLEMLGEEERQILIFTCHSREEDILRQLEIPFHKIDLST